VSALAPVLSRRGGRWIGWPGLPLEKGGAWEAVLAEGYRDCGYDLVPVLLDGEEVRGFYEGFSNGILWPLFHDLLGRCNFDPSFWYAYQAVNRKFADCVVEHSGDDDFIWVQDYQLIHVAQLVREQTDSRRIGFFLHIPFPPLDILLKLPWRAQILAALLAYDLIGFQTPRDSRNFLACLEHLVPQAEIVGGEPIVEVRIGHRTVRVGAFPIGIDVEQFHRYAFTAPGNREFARMQSVLRGRDQFIGVDRLDYSKGLLRRMDAFGRYLEAHPKAHGQVILLQVAPVSRGDLTAYRSFRQELDREAARVNGRFSRFDWTPVHYLNRALPRRTLAGLYRASRVGIVTPMRDGMNLVAMEYVAAQDPADPGVLVLSRFAGAAQYLREAVIVNPYDGEETAAAMHLAREMRIQERRRRHEALMRRLRARDVACWRRGFLAALGEAPAGRRGSRKAR